MKLKSSYIYQDIDGVRYLVPVGGQAFHGMARGNKTAAYIIDLLQQDTSEDEIVDAMCARFDAPREKIAADVARILNILRKINALEE